MTLLEKILRLIDTKNSWGKNQLRDEILNLIAKDVKMSIPSHVLYEGSRGKYSRDRHENIKDRF